MNYTDLFGKAVQVADNTLTIPLSSLENLDTTEVSAVIAALFLTAHRYFQGEWHEGGDRLIDADGQFLTYDYNRLHDKLNIKLSAIYPTTKHRVWSYEVTFYD